MFNVVEAFFFLPLRCKCAHYCGLAASFAPYVSCMANPYSQNRGVAIIADPDCMAQ